MSHGKSIGVSFFVLLLIALTLSSSAMAAPPQPPSTPDFGPNVLIFDPSMPTSEIQAAVDAVYNQQVDDEMGPNRYALLFMPGTYGSNDNPLFVRVGYYTEVAGLGDSPTDVCLLYTSMSFSSTATSGIS